MPQDNEPNPHANQQLNDMAKALDAKTADVIASRGDQLRAMSESAKDKTAESAPHDEILQFFEYAHLPPKLQDVSRAFHALAWHVHDTVPRNPERTVALRKLLEGKDAAVRAALRK